MKRIFIVMLAVFGSVSAFKASAQTTTQSTTTTTTHRYYYYPEENVYFDPDANYYWIYETPSTKWVRVQTLPGTIVVAKKPRYIVRYEGADPWKENAEHIKKYKIKKNGDVKVKDK